MRPERENPARPFFEARRVAVAMVGRPPASSGKPAVAWLYGPSTSLDEWRGNLESIGIPCFGDLRGAVAALAGWDRMYRRGLEPGPPAPVVDAERLCRLKAAADATRSASRVSLSEAQALDLLDAWGVSTVAREPVRMIVESGVSVVLDAHRGGPAGDRCALRDLLVRLAALADTDAGVHEVEINPLVVGDEGAGATAVDALVTMERR